MARRRSPEGAQGTTGTGSQLPTCPAHTQQRWREGWFAYLCYLWTLRSSLPCLPVACYRFALSALACYFAAAFPATRQSATTDVAASLSIPVQRRLADAGEDPKLQNNYHPPCSPMQQSRTQEQHRPRKATKTQLDGSGNLPNYCSRGQAPCCTHSLYIAETRAQMSPFPSCDDWERTKVGQSAPANGHCISPCARVCCTARSLANNFHLQVSAFVCNNWSSSALCHWF
jgi:hypothetical protein